MSENIVLDVAFVIAAVSFFRVQFGIAKGGAIMLAFVISLSVGAMPYLVTWLPALAPVLDVLVRVIGLFIAAAGSWDTVGLLFRKRASTR